MSRWLDDVDPHTQKLSPSAVVALQQLGTNAVPPLLIEASGDSFHPGDILIELLRKQSWLRVHGQTGSDHQARALQGFSALGETEPPGEHSDMISRNRRVAGASERLAPGLIKNMEKSLTTSSR